MYHTSSLPDLSPYSPAIMQSYMGWGRGAGRDPCISIPLHPRATWLPRRHNHTPLLCATPGAQSARWYWCLPCAIQVCSWHATAVHKLHACRVASPPLAVASFNMVISLPRGRLAWMEDLAVSEDMFLFTILMTNLANRIRRFFVGYSVNQGCTSD